MAGIQNVAKKAGVGIGTVSRVINKNGYVSEETRKKVEKAIEELNYTPNEIARNLIQNRTNIIAVIVPDVAYPYFAELTSEVEKCLRKHGYKAMICNTSEEKSNEQVYLDMLSRNMVDGILTATHSLNTENYIKTHKPIVSFDTIEVEGEIPVITVDHKRGGKLAAQELLNAGCRKILQFRNREIPEHITFFERHEEFEKTIKKAGAECINVYVNWNDFNLKHNESLIEECIKKYPEADGFFSTDAAVLNYMKIAQLNGIKIPEDMKFVAYDGTSMVFSAYPTVTVIAQPIKELASSGVELLLDIINGKKPEKYRITHKVKLIKGMTTS
ncbi:MAG: LacI family DNA-binding transcriptional regulator [Oribacterium sp.]|nr:LacI family DNA-binding transcriptional regulator [Oribacterium sp.]